MDRAHFAHKLFLVRRAEVFLPFLYKHLLNKQPLLPWEVKSTQLNSVTMPRQQLFQVVLLLVATLAASVRSDPLDNFPYRRDAILEYKPMQEHGSMNELQKRATCDPNNTDGCPDGYRPQRFDDPDYGKFCACVVSIPYMYLLALPYLRFCYLFVFIVHVKKFFGFLSNVEE